MLFIAHCKITETPYMNDDKRYSKTHLVEAEDYNEARRKIEAYYDSRCDSYAVSYRVDITDLEETIV